MPRGRHRVSPPLHRLLPSLTVAGSASALAVLAWFSPLGAHGMYLRVLVAVVAAVACVSAILLRRWDRAAGKRVAELQAARTRDEWHTDERVAELESDLEEAREIRHRQETELRSKRAELTRLRNEHAELLRRYANAESERARALESRRRLAIESGTAPRAITPSPERFGPAAFQAADEALRHLSRNAAQQQAVHTVEAARHRESVAAEHDPEERHGRHAPGAAEHSRPQLRPVPEHHLVPAAAAVLPYAQPTRQAAGRTQGGFDFFGVSKQPELESQEQPEVIDLTEHDETEQLDLRELRAHS